MNRGIIACGVYAVIELAGFLLPYAVYVACGRRDWVLLATLLLFFVLHYIYRLPSAWKSWAAETCPDQYWCRYRDVFGRPGEGVHSYRIMGLAAVDVGLTAGVALVIARSFKTGFAPVMLALIVLATCVHRLFCVDTALVRRLFGPSRV